MIVDTSYIMLACGEHTFVWRRVSNPWLLPVPRIIGQNSALHRQLIECHGYAKDLVSKRSLRCRDELRRCRVSPCFDAHAVQEADAQIRRLESAVDEFVTKWSTRVRRWSLNMAEEEYANEARQLLEEAAAFKEIVLKIESYAQSVNSLIERYVRSGYVPEDVSLYEEFLAGWLPAACRHLTAIGQGLRAHLRHAALFGALWTVFAAGCWVGVNGKNSCWV